MAPPAQLDPGGRTGAALLSSSSQASTTGDSQAAWRPWMERALQLAALGQGRTSPNPMVGRVE